MKFIRWTYILAMLLAMLTAACNGKGDEPPVSPLPGEPVMLTLDVRSIESSMGTRTDSYYEENDTTGFELPATAYEKMHSVRVIIVRPDGTVEANRYTPVSDAGIFEFPDEMTMKVASGETKKIYVVANEDAVPYRFSDIMINDIFPEEEVIDIQLSREKNRPLFDNSGTGRTYIPMSEIFDVEVKTPVNEEDFHQSVSLFVTRAAVKFSFELQGVPDLPVNNLYIKDISINGIADKEYLFPHNTIYKPGKYQPSSNSLNRRFITSYSIPADADTIGYTFNLPDGLLSATTEKKSYIPYIYLPESPEQSYTVKINTGGGTPQFPGFYNEVRLPNLPSLPRNTHVRVIMTLTGPHTIDMEVKVMPYLSVPLDPSFGI